MKKLFSIFFAFALLLPVSTYAQLLMAETDVQGKYPPVLKQATHSTNKVSTRRNIPKVAQPLGTWCSVKWGKTNHNIATKWVYYNNGDWDYSSPADQFIKVEAYDASKSSNNYIVLFFWTQHSQYYNGVLGPEAGEYTMQSANVSYGTWGWVWTVPSNVWGIKVIDYSYIQSVQYSRWGYWYPGLCSVSSAAGNYAGSLSNTTMTTAFSNATIYVQVGKDDNMFINVDIDGTPWFTIGEPKEYKVRTSASHGKITLSDSENNRTYTDCGTYNPFYEGTSIRFTPVPDAGYSFSSWTWNNTEAGNDNPMDWTVEYGDQDANDIINITANFAANPYVITLNNQSATTAGTASVTATFDASTNLTSAITKPTKTGFDFGGYYTETNGGGTQIIDANGSFIASAGGSSTYTDGSRNWKYANNITLYAKWIAAVTNYHLAWDAGDGVLVDNAVYSYAVEGDYPGGEELPDGAPNATREGYQLTGWLDEEHDLPFDENDWIMPSYNVTYTAQWTATTYDLTYEGLEGATNTNPATYTVESETITLAAPGARDGYVFTGWTCGGEAITEITHGSTGDKTITANWHSKLSAIELEDNRENSFYNTFKNTYNGESGLIVTYARQFTEGRWSTLCLPFNVNKNMFSSLDFGSRIYEFRYATGNANVGSGVNLYFSIAKSIVAGKAYIVNADATLAGRTSFTFSGVTMDLSADKGDELNSVTAYDKLENGCSTEDSNIELVGTLRKGTLKGTTDGNTYMGLKENKIYYPNIATGSTILAYRGIFRSKTGTLNAERIRIIVDGEEKAELEAINGELQDVLETKKFIENGVLYIERNGIIYDATGRKVE